MKTVLCFATGIATSFINSCKAEANFETTTQNAQNLTDISDEKWIKVFNSEKPDEEMAKLFREYFNLPSTQEILVMAKSDGNGTYGPVLVAKIFENGIDTKKRYLAFAFFPGIYEGFKGIIFIDTSNFAVSGIKVETKPSNYPNPGENFPVNINIQSTDQNGKAIEKRYNLRVVIDGQSNTYDLSHSQLVEFLGDNFTGANLYWFTNIEELTKTK